MIKIYKQKFQEFFSLRKSSYKPHEKNNKKKQTEIQDNTIVNKNKHFKSMSFCDHVGNKKEENNEKNEEKEEIFNDDSIDLVINNLKFVEFEKEVANLKSNIAFLINSLMDVDVSQVDHFFKKQSFILFP